MTKNLISSNHLLLNDLRSKHYIDLVTYDMSREAITLVTPRMVVVYQTYD